MIICCFYDMMIDSNIIDLCENEKITYVTQKVKKIKILWRVIIIKPF